MALPEVVRAAELLTRAWGGSPPADAGGRERCRQLIVLLRQHEPALVAQAERPGAPVDAARLQQALAEVARRSPPMRTLLGQLAQPRPAGPRPTGQEQIIIHGGRVITDDAPRTFSQGSAEAPRILFLAANPLDTVPLRLGQEQREIREALERTGGRYLLETREAVRPRDLTLALMQLRPRIIHFSGHGEAGGTLCLENDAGETHEVTPQALAAVFGVLAGKIDCVVLNACFSALQAEEIAKHVRYVVGMRHEVGDDASVAFATGFYQALGAGATVPEAVAMGRGLFGMMNLPEHLLPVVLQEGVPAG